MVIATETRSATDSALRDTACTLVAPGQGILAIDESVATITKRFTALGIESTV
jgi:fructose-bisphosphate aldolase class I